MCVCVLPLSDFGSWYGRDTERTPTSLYLLLGKLKNYRETIIKTKVHPLDGTNKYIPPGKRAYPRYAGNSQNSEIHPWENVHEDKRESIGTKLTVFHVATLRLIPGTT